VPRLPDIRGVLDELEAAGPVVLADKGYQGDAYAKIPYRGRTSRNPSCRPARQTRDETFKDSSQVSAYGGPSAVLVPQGHGDGI
jgi:hypothetical protein